MKFLLDATVLIDHFNRIDAATQFLAEQGADSAVSVVTVTEVLSGGKPDEIGRQELLLAQYRTLGIDLDIAKQAAALRRKFRWKLADSYQGALALRHGLKLVTRNTRDFDPKKMDFVLSPYTI